MFLLQGVPDLSVMFDDHLNMFLIINEVRQLPFCSIIRIIKFCLEQKGELLEESEEGEG